MAGTIQAARDRAANPRAPILILIIAAVIAGLWIADSFLARVEQNELQGEAQDAYAAGSRLLHEGKVREAVVQLRKAHSLERDNTSYELELISALMAAGKIDEAEPLLNDVLERDPNEGRANLIAARLMLKKRRVADAKAYYHRAIYGSWPADAAQHRIAARLELINLIKANGTQEELLAELLPLQEEIGKDESLEERLANLFLVAGSPFRAADLYAKLIAHSSKDAEAYAGLGEADLELGDYRAAHIAFAKTATLKPGDASLLAHLNLSHTLNELDPTPRGLGSREKYRRSLKVLDLARNDLEQCVAKSPEGRSQSEQLLVAADDVLSNEPQGAVPNEVSDSVLALAQQIWQARLKICGPAISSEEALRLIMEKVAR